MQAFWIRVRCPEDRLAGVYRGTLTVSVREPAEERTLPFTDLSARSWVTLNGDGCWTAVGPGGRPLPTQRLKNFRDGLEDYAYAMELERRLAAHPHGAWAAKAKALIAVPVRVMDTMTNFTGDPREVLAWRDAMADLIDADGDPATR